MMGALCLQTPLYTDFQEIFSENQYSKGFQGFWLLVATGK
jgi:hypothetical protein